MLENGEVTVAWAENSSSLSAHCPDEHEVVDLEVPLLQSVLLEVLEAMSNVYEKQKPKLKLTLMWR